MNSALETLETTKLCINNEHYKDALNRSYYAAFYAVKAVLAIEEIDFRRHKDVIAYFNKTYIASSVFDKKIGRMLATLQQTRETSDYDDFYIASKEEAETQCQNASYIIQEIEKYLKEKI